MIARVRNFQWAGIALSFNATTEDDFERMFRALEAIQALPSLQCFRASGWLGLEPSSVYLEPRNQVPGDGPLRAARKREIKVLLRASGFKVVAESVAIGRQVR